MKFETKRTKEDVEKLYNRLADNTDKPSKYPGMTYEEGCLAVLDYLDGNAEAEEIY